jgi:hypothetical protein
MNRHYNHRPLGLLKQTLLLPAVHFQAEAVVAELGGGAALGGALEVAFHD